jgi:hypothetical protein
MKLCLEIGFGICVLLLIMFNWDDIINEIKYLYHLTTPSFVLSVIIVIILCLLIAL